MAVMRSSSAERPPPGVSQWVRELEVEWESRPLPPARPAAGTATGAWQVVAPAGHSRAAEFGRTFGELGTGPGGVGLLPEEAEPREQDVVELVQ